MTRLPAPLFNGLLIVGSYATWFLLMNLLTGAPMAVAGYFLADLDAETQGEIVTSEIRHGRRGATRAQVRYEFIAGDRVYRSNVLSYRALSSDEPGETVARYPVGKTVNVHYDSGSPHYSVLDPGPLEGYIWVQIVAGLIFATLTVFVFRRS